MTETFRLLKLDSTGAVVQTVGLANSGTGAPAFDGSNIRIPDNQAGISIVRASTGTLLTTLAGNGLGYRFAAASDGERVLVTTDAPSAGVSLWRSADLAPLGFRNPHGYRSR